MLRRWRAEILVGAAGIAIGVVLGIVLGVGRTSEQDRVRDAAAAYLHAFADGDPAAVCDHISPLSQKLSGAESCEAGARASIRQLKPADRDALHDAKVTVTSIAGDRRATVRFTPKLNGRGDMQLVKVDGRWLVGV